MRQLLWLTSGKRALFLILALGCLIRLVALFNVTVINPDGILYIEQAKAIASGQWGFLTHYELQYVSLYPFLIAFVHLLVPNWIACGQLVSLSFGCGLLILLYLLVRLFFSRKISSLSVLLFSVTPLLVRYSADVMRDSVYWFFYCASVLVFLAADRFQGNNARYVLGVTAAIVLALLAAWCRIEAIILLPVFCFYLLFFWIKNRFRLMMGFLLLIAVLSGIVALGATSNALHCLQLVRLNEVVAKFYEPMRSYGLLRSQLHPIASSYGFSLLGNFLSDAYHIVWIMPFAVLLRNVAEAFFYPFLPFYFLGFVEMAKWRIRHTPLLLFWMLIGIGFIVLYLHVLQTWVMTYRFIALLLLPSTVIAASGIERCLRLLQPRFGVPWAVMAVALWLCLFPLWKNLEPIEADKGVYPAIAAKAVALTTDHHPPLIAGLSSVPHRWISFYATARYDTPIPHSQCVIHPRSMAQLVSSMHAKKMEFLLWEQRAWAKRPFGRSPADFLGQFSPVGEWRHDDTGKLILFRLKDKA